MSQSLLSARIKEETKKSHQELEKKVVLKLKGIRSEADYAGFLNSFYNYFNTVEKANAPYISNKVLSDYTERRNSSYLKADIEELGFEIKPSIGLPQPEITSLPAALGAMYVMEGSIMGGPIIVEILKKHGITKGFSFFSGYGAETGKMWSAFVSVLNANASDEQAKQIAVNVANDTFAKFQSYF